MAFVLSSDLADPLVTLDDVAAAIASVHASIEICGSRLDDWKVTIVDTVAANASAGAFVLGDQRVALSDVDLVGATLSLSVNGEVRSTGTGAGCMGSPPIAAQWLAPELASRNTPLRAGDIVLTGALGPMVAVNPGDSVEASIAGLGDVKITFAQKAKN